jgi:hypothetical protein
MIEILVSTLKTGRWTSKVVRPFCFAGCFFGAVLAVALFSIEEAHVSEVFYEDSQSTLEDQVQWSKEIVIVEGGKPASVVLRKVVFPKETHHQKLHESTYTEMVDVYKVKEVLRSAKLKKGDLIKVFESPAYDEASMRAYHEEDMSESPIVTRYKPVNPAKDEDEKILLLNVHLDKSGEPMVSDKAPVFVFQAAEHVKSKAQVLDVIAGKIKSNVIMPDQVKSKREK